MGRLLLFILLVSNNALAGVVDTVPLKPACCTSTQPAGISLRCRASQTFKEQPLYIVDGVPYDSFDLKKINPNEILRIDVLKSTDASAIYGSRALGGVVIITTRRAKRIVIQDADSKASLEAATVVACDETGLNKPIMFIAGKNGEVDLSRLNDEAKYELTITSVGYQTKKMSLSGKDNTVVNMQRDFKRLDKVVIVSPAAVTCRHCGCKITVVNNLERKDSTANSPSFSVFPNPAKTMGAVTLRLQESLRGKIEIINAWGQIIQTISMSGKSLFANFNLNCSDAGMYFIRFTEPGCGEPATQKLIVQ